ncbi:efflux RND transporter periplasmic adaptor subunit [Cytophagales bacterium RKSG123]|nr:efflux RND transporter periplasmic adaptor subunit [Xanthovirga aplysinae]
MKKANYLILSAFLILAGCGSKDLNDKKAMLEEFRKEERDLVNKIHELETELAKEDPEFAASLVKKVLITTLKVNPQPYDHFMSFRGNVESDLNVMVSPEIGGIIEKIYVVEGQKVAKGQKLLTLDGSILRNSIAELKTSLELAETTFERQERLWKQNIGTEMQFLQAKNNRDALVRKLSTLNAQLEQTIVRAPFSGTVDDVPAKVGQLASPGASLVHIIGLNQMYVRADISETYVGNFDKGNFVQLTFPSLNKTVDSEIRSVGQVIDQVNRTFLLEAKMPDLGGAIKANEVAYLKVRDEHHDNAIVVPSHLIQYDDEGDYVFINQKNTAKKVYITKGSQYNNMTRIIKGLKGGEQLINDGSRQVENGSKTKFATKKSL